MGMPGSIPPGQLAVAPPANLEIVLVTHAACKRWHPTGRLVTITSAGLFGWGMRLSEGDVVYGVAAGRSARGGPRGGGGAVVQRMRAGQAPWHGRGCVPVSAGGGSGRWLPR